MPASDAADASSQQQRPQAQPDIAVRVLHGDLARALVAFLPHRRDFISLARTCHQLAMALMQPQRVWPRRWRYVRIESIDQLQTDVTPNSLVSQLPMVDFSHVTLNTDPSLKAANLAMINRLRHFTRLDSLALDLMLGVRGFRPSFAAVELLRKAGDLLLRQHATTLTTLRLCHFGTTLHHEVGRALWTLAVQSCQSLTDLRLDEVSDKTIAIVVEDEAVSMPCLRKLRRLTLAFEGVEMPDDHHSQGIARAMLLKALKRAPVPAVASPPATDSVEPIVAHLSSLGLLARAAAEASAAVAGGIGSSGGTGTGTGIASAVDPSATISPSSVDVRFLVRFNVFHVGHVRLSLPAEHVHPTEVLLDDARILHIGGPIAFLRWFKSYHHPRAPRASLTLNVGPYSFSEECEAAGLYRAASTIILDCRTVSLHREIDSPNYSRVWMSTRMPRLRCVRFHEYTNVEAELKTIVTRPIEERLLQQFGMAILTRQHWLARQEYSRETGIALELLSTPQAAAAAIVQPLMMRVEVRRANRTLEGVTVTL